MRDDFLTADWARHHDGLSDAIANAVKTIRTSLARLHKVQFDSPWHRVR